MELLEKRILSDAKVLPGNIIKVDGFLNRMIDVSLIDAMAKEWHRLFANEGVTKVLTVESSGIALASVTGLEFGVPALFARKVGSSTSKNDLSVKVVSFTHGNTYTVSIPKDLISENDRVLIVDDLIANGSALKALIKVCEKGGAKVVGVGIAIEKAYQKGGSEIREKGYRVESLARIKSIDESGNIEFC